MITSKRFLRPILIFLSLTLIFQTFAPALIYAQEATQSAEVTSGSVPVVHENVAEGVDYRFKDSKVSVRFTKIQTAGKLTIREVKLTPEQIASTGALSDTAYDITSDMENGSFLYDLTLPLPQNNQNAKVEFASDQNSLDQSVVIDTNVTENPDTIEIKDLDHFTIFFVTNGVDQATNGDMCGVLYDCSIDANLPSLEVVDTNYLDINSFDETTSAIWPNGDFSDDRYVQFNFSPSLDTDALVENSRLKIVYKTNEIDESLDFGAKVIVSGDNEFDEDTDFVTTSIVPNATKPGIDQSFTIDLPGEYQDADVLNNLKVRFYFFGDPLAEDISGVTTSFNQVVLLVNYSPPTSTFDTIDNPTNNNSPTITGTATSNGGATVKNVEYKVDAGLWIPALASDGIFNFASELFKFSLSALTEGNHVFETKVIDSLDTIQTEMVSLNLTVDTTIPDITVPTNITSEATSSLGAIVTYTSPTATDTQDGSDAVSCDKNSGNTFPLGLTTVHCSSTDTAGNTANKTFNVTVSDTIIPVITLNGTTPITLEVHSSYTDAGASASDNIDGDRTSSIVTVNPVNKDVLGPYVVTYNVSDSSGNPAAQVTRTVNVVDTTAPTKPTATPTSGDYFSDQSVTLSSGDEGSGLANIYYTTDGSSPEATKTLYEGAISVDKDMTIKAIAYDNVGNASDILEAVYGIAPKISAETSSSVTSTSTTITWTTDDPATSRVIYDTVSHSLGEAPNYGYTDSTVETDTEPKVLSHSVIISELATGTIYYYRTVSHGSPESVSDEHSFTTSSISVGGGGSGVSDGKSVTPSAPVCSNTKPGSSPTLLSAFGGVNNVILKWTEAVDPLTYYLITYGTKPGAQTYGNLNIGGKGTTGYTVSGLSGGITYYFQVRAGNGCAPGDFSNELSATTLGVAIAGEAPAEGFTPGVKGASTELTPTPTASVLGETKNNQFSWWLIFLIIATGGFGIWIFFRRR